MAEANVGAIRIALVDCVGASRPLLLTCRRSSCPACWGERVPSECWDYPAGLAASVVTSSLSYQS